MTNLVSTFRGFIVASVVMGLAADLLDVAAGLLPADLPAKLSGPLNSYADSRLPDSFTLMILIGVVLVLFIVLLVVSTVGLFLLKRWSRPLALWTTIVAALSYPLFGAVLASGWSAALGTISIALWGAVLAMAYFSELKARFEKWS